MKPYIPQIRIISVEHDLTIEAEQRIAHAMRAHKLSYPVRAVFCHLEAGRCGIPAGKIAIEVDGQIIWSGNRLTEKLADSFCEGLPTFIKRQMEEFGMTAPPK